jgi:site-specific DNA-methyltransferase (adenine-specific)
MNRIVNGDILRFAAHYRGPRFHAVLCDPPYELGFMGKSWDSRGVSFRAETWAAIGSLLAPGAHLLAFGGTRTFHRIAVAIEDAGFEIRDTIGWMYGSGFPKSHDVSKAIDREAGAERILTRQGTVSRGGLFGGWDVGSSDSRPRFDIPSTGAARAWQGYGTALKPAWEPVIVARKPFVGTVAQNCLAHGCGAINVDGARVGDENTLRTCNGIGQSSSFNLAAKNNHRVNGSDCGRWPANIIHDGSDETAEVLGDAARFFYTAKASSREREEGLEGFEGRPPAFGNESGDGLGRGISNTRQDIPRRNHHPTVKPLALTQYLATLILPPPHVESRILVPFAGSGSECIGAALAGWRTVVGVEREAEYAAIARARLEHWTRQLPA